METLKLVCLDWVSQERDKHIWRDELVLTFTTLAQFGAQAATGEFFIFHFGV